MLILSIRQLGGCSHQIVRNHRITALELSIFICYSKWSSRPGSPVNNWGLLRNAARINIAGRNINNLIYVDDTTLMAESEDELKSLLTKVKEESGPVGLKLYIKKTKVMTGPITPWQRDGEMMETVRSFILGGSKVTADEIKRCLLLGRKAMTNLDSILKSRVITLQYSWNYEPLHVGPSKTDGSWWRVLTKHAPLEKGMANHFNILALRTPWTAWKGKKDMILKDELPRSVGTQYSIGEK